MGQVGFCASFGAKYYGGYARAHNKDGTIFDVPKQAINSLRKQSKKVDFKNIKFYNKSFLDLPLEKIKGYVIYCDIPYKGTTKYKTESFPYEEFYQWVKDMSVHNTVLISEYTMPAEFECIWLKETKTLLDSNKDKNDKKNVRIEKLFTYKNNS